MGKGLIVSCCYFSQLTLLSVVVVVVVVVIVVGVVLVVLIVVVVVTKGHRYKQHKSVVHFNSLNIGDI